jgi:hypothetical protein
MFRVGMKMKDGDFVEPGSVARVTGKDGGKRGVFLLLEPQ